MEFGCFFVGQRPQVHDQYASTSNENPNPVHRTDAEVYDTYLKGALLAEDLGFDSVWVAEHAFTEHGVISSPHTLLAAIAAQTKRVKVGVAVTIVPWYHPLRMAQDLATIDVISNGRLIAGVGRGYAKAEFDAYGLDMSDSRERFVEGMDISVKAWTKERFSYDGSFFSFPQVMVVPKPIQKPHPPVWMAVTNSPESVDIAVRNRWHLFTTGSTFFPAAPEADENLIKLYRSKLQDSGVEPDDMTIAAVRRMYVAHTSEEAERVMAPKIEWSTNLIRSLRAPAAALAAAGSLRGYEQYSPDRDPLLNRGLGEKQAVEAMGAIGTPEKVIATIEELQAKHVGHFIAYVDTGGPSFDEIQRSLRLFAQKVMPRFQQANRK